MRRSPDGRNDPRAPFARAPSKDTTTKEKAGQQSSCGNRLLPRTPVDGRKAETHPPETHPLAPERAARHGEEGGSFVKNPPRAGISICEEVRSARRLSQHAGRNYSEAFNFSSCFD